MPFDFTLGHITDRSQCNAVLSAPITYQSFTGPPGVTNDSADTAGYGVKFEVGNVWINDASSWLCTDATPGAAVWTAQGGGGSSVSITTNSGTVANGATLTVTHAADSANVRQCFASATVPVYGNQVPVMTGNTTPSGTVSVSSAYSGAYDGWYAFDGNLDGSTSIWCTQGTSPPHWLQYQFPSATKVNRYGLVVNYDIQSPTDWKFQGSTDGSTWVNLDQRAGQAIYDGSVHYYNVFPFIGTANYAYYRILISNAGDSHVRLNEMQLIGPTGATINTPVLIGSASMNSMPTSIPMVLVNFTSDTTTTFTNMTGDSIALVASVSI